MSRCEYCYIDLRLSAEAINDCIRRTEAHYVAFGYGDEQDGRAYFDSLLVVAASNEHAVTIGSVFVRKKTRASFQRHFPNQMSTLDSETNYTYGLMYPDGVLCRARDLREAGLTFDPTLNFCRDELFAMQFNLVFRNVFYVPTSKYRSRRVFDEVSRNTPQADDPRWYWELTGPVFERILELGGGALAPVSQYAMLYALIQRFDSNQNKYVKAVFKDVEETRAFLESATSVLKQIDDSVLFRRVPAIAWSRPRLVHFAAMKYGKDNIDWVIDDKPKAPVLSIGNSGKPVRIERLGDSTLLIYGIRLSTDDSGRTGFEVSARYFTNFPDSAIDVYLVNEFSGRVERHKLEHTSVYATRIAFFGEVAYVCTLYCGFVPLAPTACNQSITALACVGKREAPLRIGIVEAGPNHLTENKAGYAWHIPGYAVRSKDWRIEVAPESDLHWRLREMRRCHKLAKGDAAQKMAAKVRCKYLFANWRYRGKRIWVYFDKGFKGGDNGEFAFKYGVSQDDGIEHVYFIEPDSRDGRRLAAEGYKTLRPGDADAMLCALNAEVIFYTQIPAFKGVGIGKREYRYYKDLLDQKLVRMYHGFMLTHDCSYAQLHMNAIGTVVGSRYEHDLCTELAHGWDDEGVIDSGMPRHDGLVADNKRQLLFAPTWRPTLRTRIGDSGETLYNPGFKESRYYKTYSAIFSNERLLSCARANGYKIKLFLHPRLAPQSVDFEPNDVFEALDCTKDSDYVTMMRQSDLMVTDFSSVMVDFAYSRKPVVYYQDPALPYWRYVDFDYEGIGFGEVCKSADELVEVLCEYMENDCSLKDFYRARINAFFYHDDQSNSKRLYEAVRRMVDSP